MSEFREKSLVLLDQVLVMPEKLTNETLLAHIAEQNAINIRIQMSELVGLKVRSRAMAFTFVALLADAANLMPVPGHFGRSISNIDIASALLGEIRDPIKIVNFFADYIVREPVAAVVGTGITIASMVLTTKAVRTWMGVGDRMREVLEYEPSKQNVPTTKP